jgi:hypothetical protein
MRMQPQLYVSRNTNETVLNAALIDPVKNRMGINKPLGGLWTSTYLGIELGSAWTLWCTRENFQGPIFPNAWLLYPEPAIKVYTINTYNDLARLLAKYAIPSEYYADKDIREIFGRRFLDFARISMDYDAIHLTKHGEYSTRLTFPLTLYGWDCESTLWFRWKFEKVERLNPLNLTWFNKS